MQNNWKQKQHVIETRNVIHEIQNWFKNDGRGRRWSEICKAYMKLFYIGNEWREYFPYKGMYKVARLHFILQVVNWLENDIELHPCSHWKCRAMPSTLILDILSKASAAKIRNGASRAMVMERLCNIAYDLNLNQFEFLRSRSGLSWFVCWRIG